MRKLAGLVVLIGSALGCGFSGSDIWEVLNRSPSRNFDRVLVSMLIPHYQGMLDMAEAYLPQAQDPQMRSWVQALIKERKERINEWKALLQQLGGLEPSAEATMKREMYKDWVNLRESQKSENVHSVFANLMLTNHFSTVNMAKMVEARSRNPKIAALAQSLIADETAHLEKLQALLIRSQ
ncbi:MULTISPECIES: DUF305 domain-containing protein [unclassified Meiothermus]|uniref:DUF305 domain-containing protein n=1 Tax=unclassified Meiothermus TaxID=370471 RepID=UPI001314EC14|nr:MULTISPECIES: DUF305 domain-containing protein [unclassified Meiothermus]